MWLRRGKVDEWMTVYGVNDLRTKGGREAFRRDEGRGDLKGRVCVCVSVLM